MDLGIKGKNAVVCASSQGLGLACAAALARESCTVIINGRDLDRLTRAQASIETSTGVKVGMVVADINTEARRRITQTVAAKRFGTPSEFADACAFLCSVQAGFISGQNLQLDGGSYPGLL